jgi:hypothetical protein
MAVGTVIRTERRLYRTVLIIADRSIERSRLQKNTRSARTFPEGKGTLGGHSHHEVAPTRLDQLASVRDEGIHAQGQEVISAILTLLNQQGIFPGVVEKYRYAILHPAGAASPSILRRGICMASNQRRVRTRP